MSEARKLAQPEDFDFLYRIGESYATLRRYAPEFLDVLKFRAAQAAEGVLRAIDVLRGMNAENARSLRDQDHPTARERLRRMATTALYFALPDWILTDQKVVADRETGIASPM